MRNKGFTIVETMVVAAISLGLMAVVFSVFITLNTALAKSSASVDLKQRAQIAINTIQGYLEKSHPETISILNCGTECSGQKIDFQIPIVTNDAISGTVFNTAGERKLGASNSSRSLLNGYHTLYVGEDPIGVEPKGLRLQVWRNETQDDPFSCFLAKTPILMANGSSKFIANIKVGDEVLAYNEKTSKTQKDKVVKLLVHENVTGYLIINGHLKVTPEHRFYSEGKWVEIGSLKVKDKLLDYKGKIQAITSIEKIKEKVTVYNFEVEPSHTYFAGGLLVHNAKLQPISEFDNNPFSKLFDTLFTIKEAFAGSTIVKNIYSDSMVIRLPGAPDMFIKGYPSNNQPYTIEVTISEFRTIISPRN